MILASPWWCLLALFALIPWVGPLKGQNRVQNVLRSLLFVALAIGLAQPRFPSNETESHRVYILDQSSSVVVEQQEVLDQVVNSESNTLQHLILLGGESQDSESAESRFQTVHKIQIGSQSGESCLSHALAQARELIPAGSTGSVTMLGDGMATRIDDARAVTALRSSGIPVHWVRLPSVQQNPQPLSAEWNSLQQGTSSQLAVRVLTNGSSGTLTLSANGKELAATDYQPQAGEAAITAYLEFEPPNADFMEATLAVSGDETNSLEVTLPVKPPHKLLYLAKSTGAGSDKLSQMLGAGFEVNQVDPKDSKAIAASLQTADLVLFDDLPAGDFPNSAEEQIVQSVKSNGLGLVMSGGRASFGAGGWHKRPIEELLPTEFVQKEEKRDPSTSLVIVIDTSGSMTGVRVQLAKEVARLAMRRLLPHDKVGIVEFYGAKRWAAPLQPASNAIELQRALNRMDAGGGTV
ncbi:MAG: VWA domain-containing protein, partial [Planctomycetota bacterium]